MFHRPMKIQRPVFAAVFGFFIFCAPGLINAQTNPVAILVYADDETAISITDSMGSLREVMIGDEIQAGETLKTDSTTAELKLDPNGSIVKLARNTVFKVEGLAATNTDTNEFSLLSGKIRAVAARTSGSKYRIRTPGAVCGVRGTDFSMTVLQGVKDAIFVKRGLVEFSRTLADGSLESVMVGAGQFADVFAQTFAPIAYTAEQIAAEYADVEFQGLDPTTVPQADTQTTTEEPQKEEPKAKPESPATPPLATGAEGPMEKKEPEPKPGSSESKIMAWLGDVLGFEIGSVIIDGETYSKAIIQPTFQLGKLKMGLYLPIIYTSDLFDPDTWYHPAGNNEWSFGGEYWDNDLKKAAFDALSDLALKIRFIEYGDRYSDPFYLNVGNLSSMTIGHGILMRNFANDSDFPAIRRIGVNTGIDQGAWGAEAVVNDLAEPEIFGGRIKMLYILGVSAIVDIDPAGDLPATEQDAIGDPMFVGGGIDLDIPIIKAQLFNLRAFADLAAVTLYTRKDIVGGPDAGLQTDMVYDESRGSGLDALRNYGFVSGFLGKALIMDWRLEFRHYRGAYRPTFFDATYERNRASYAKDFAYLLAGSDDTVSMNGIYGEAGFSLIQDRLAFTAGYMMPWSSSSSVDWDDVMQKDYILAKLVIKKGLIPIYDISGSVSYERTGFVYTLLHGKGNVNLFDENTVFKGELVVPIAQTVDFATVLSTALVRDSDGNIIYEDDSPKVEPTLTFETRIHF